MPENSYIDILTCNLARVVPDTSRCVLYPADGPSWSITADISTHLGELYSTRTIDELAIIIGGDPDLRVVFIFAEKIDGRLYNLLQGMLRADPNLWIFHAKRHVAADAATGEISYNIMFELIETAKCNSSKKSKSHKLKFFEQILQDIQNKLQL